MRFILHLGVILIHVCTHAQTTFFNRINHPGYSTTIKVLSDGNLVTGAMDTSAFIQKTDTNGIIIWQRRLPIWWVQMIEVEETADQGILVLMSQPYLQGRCTYLLKLRSDGTTEWYYLYHDMVNDFHLDIQALPDTGFLMIGSGCTAPGAQLTRCRKDGSIRWQKNYLDSAGKYFGFTRLTLCDNGRNFFFLGFTTIPSVETELAVGKIDTAGNMLWMKEFSQPGLYENPQALISTKNGFIAAYDAVIFQSSTSYSRNSLAAFDTSGNMVWHTRYTFTHGATGRSIALLPDSTLLVGGMMLYDQDTTKFRALLMHTSSMGQQLSSPTFSDSVYGNYSCQFVESIATSGSNAYLTGGGYSMYIAKANSQGFGMCNPHYNSPSTTYLPLLSATPRTCYTTPGLWTRISATSPIDTAVTLQGYTSCLNIITSTGNQQPENTWTIVQGQHSYSWIIESDLPFTDAEYSVQIRDLNGRIIPVEVNTLDLRSTEISLASQISDGIYLVTVVTNEFHQHSEKLLMQH